MGLSGFKQIFGDKRGLTVEHERQKYGPGDKAEPPKTYSIRVERAEDQWRAVVSYDNIQIACWQDAGKRAVVGRACRSIRKHATDLGE
jgi:hypothetical protein